MLENLKKNKVVPISEMVLSDRKLVSIHIVSDHSSKLSKNLKQIKIFRNFQKFLFILEMVIRDRAKQ